MSTELGAVPSNRTAANASRIYGKLITLTWTTFVISTFTGMMIWAATRGGFTA